MNQPEPWLRGPLPGVHPLLMPLFHAFQHAREELASETEGLTVEQLWARPFELTSLGFHIRHIGGGAERLGSYIRQQPLTPAQLAAITAESAPGAGRQALLQQMDTALAGLERYVRTIDPATLAQPRTVGRQQLPTSVIGLLTHIAEHTLRHTGQAVTTARLIRSMKKVC